MGSSAVLALALALCGVVVVRAVVGCAVERREAARRRQRTCLVF